MSDDDSSDGNFPARRAAAGRKIHRRNVQSKSVKKAHRTQNDLITPPLNAIGQQDRKKRQAKSVKATLPAEIPVLVAAYGFMQALQQRRGWIEAASMTVRDLLKHPSTTKDARLLAFGLLKSDPLIPLDFIPWAIYLAGNRQYIAAYKLFRAAPLADVLRLAPAEYARCLYICDPGDVAAIFANEERLALLRSDPSVLIEIAGIAAAAGDRQTAEHLERKFRSCPDALAPIGGLSTWIQQLFAANRPSVASPADVVARPADVCLGILDYQHCDMRRVSRNIGDYIQTLALLGMLACFDADFNSNDESTKGVLDKLAARVRPERKINQKLSASVVKINRDRSNFDNVRQKTWVFVYGWYMSRVFNMKFDFPLHPNIVPIFISFHVHMPEMLTPEAIAYLKRHSPIGCRDWSTVFLLRGFGVDCFFSGCLTLTLSNILEKSIVGIKGKTAYVDCPSVEEKEDGVYFAHEYDQVRQNSFAENLTEALGRLDTYRTDFAYVETSRLHCYLPCMAIGKRVVFKPKRPEDTRFDGLAELDAASVKTIRNALYSKVKRIVGAIARGAPAKKVYAEWRAICQADVGEALLHCQEAVAPSFADADVSAIVAKVGRRQYFGSSVGSIIDEIEIAVAVDATFFPMFETCLASIVAHTTRKIRVWILGRSIVEQHIVGLTERYEGVRFELIDCTSADVFKGSGRPEHVSESGMDRLLIPDLIPVEKIVYIDVDAIVLSDIAEVFDLQSDTAISARPRRNANLQLHHDVEAACRRLAPKRASDLRRLVLGRIPATRPTFNAGFMVLDLARMRADKFAARFLPFIDLYKTNDQELLNFYAEGIWTELPKGWNVIAGYEYDPNPKMLHWAGVEKPWHTGAVPLQEIWSSFAMPPAGNDVA